MSNIEVYSIADALHMTLGVTDTEITGSSEKEVDLGVMKLTVPYKVVSSLRTPKNEAVLVRSIGNIALLIISKYHDKHPLTLFMIDIAKLGVVPEGCLEKWNSEVGPPGSIPIMPSEIKDKVSKAVVAEFNKTENHQWLRV